MKKGFSLIGFRPRLSIDRAAFGEIAFPRTLMNLRFVGMLMSVNEFPSFPFPTKKFHFNLSYKYFLNLSFEAKIEYVYIYNISFTQEIKR